MFAIATADVCMKFPCSASVRAVESMPSQVGVQGAVENQMADDKMQTDIIVQRKQVPRRSRPPARARPRGSRASRRRAAAWLLGWLLDRSRQYSTASGCALVRGSLASSLEQSA